MSIIRSSATSGGQLETARDVQSAPSRHRRCNRWRLTVESRRCWCYICCWWWTIVQLVPNTTQGYFLAMLSEGQVYIINAGNSIKLDCSFQADSYNLFDYPVLWRKTQRDEDTQINIMSNINEPFVNEGGRFEVVFTSSASSHYHLQLSILDVSQQDSGNYTCEVRGPQSALLGHVTHYVFVRAPVERIVLTDSNVSSSLSVDGPTSPRTTRVIENQPAPLRCVAFGGYPPPILSVYVGGRDVTKDFRFSHVATMTGQLGLRTISYRTERWTDRFAIDAEFDQQTIKCIATVPGLRSNVEMVRVNVEYSPKITCYFTEAFVGEKNVNVRCDVRSKPRLSALFWIIDSNGTALSEGEVINGHWTLVMDRSEGLVEAQLFVKQVRSEFFRKYTIVAENNVAIATSDVELSQKFHPTVSVLSATANQLSINRGSVRGGSSLRSIHSASARRTNHHSSLYLYALSLAVFTTVELTVRTTFTTLLLHGP